MDTIITTTNVPLSVQDNIPKDWHETAMESAKELKGAIQTPGVYYRMKERDGKIAVFTLERIDLKKAYKDANEADRLAHFSDGYKRTKINSPAAIRVKTALGLIKESKTLEYQKKIFADMIKAGIDEEQAKRIAFPTRG